jgi:hypothetical protein
MNVRVVRFSDVTRKRIDELTERMNASDGPPEGVPSVGIQLLFDEDQGTAVVVQLFDSAEDLAAGEAALEAMDAGETPGTRVSVDRCVVQVERRLES